MSNDSENSLTPEQESRRDIIVVLMLLAFVGALVVSGLVFGPVGVVFPMIGMAGLAILIMVVFSFG